VAKEFQPGEEVLVYKPIRRVGRAEKLLHHWHGPYVVQRNTASLNYEVKQKDKRKTEIVHVGKMKKFLGSEREEVSNEEGTEEEGRRRSDRANGKEEKEGDRGKGCNSIYQRKCMGSMKSIMMEKDRSKTRTGYDDRPGHGERRTDTARK
jgi:hypothetical protein